MKNNRVYMQVDAADKREDFQLWYADGDVFLTVKKNNWAEEKDRVAIYNRFGGEMARIKPDPKCITYNVGVERYEYELHTYALFEHYFFKGMLWDIQGSLADKQIDFRNEGTGKLDVRVTMVKFKDKGRCYEIKVKDLSKLRIAACCVIAMALKESYKGLSEGEPVEGEKFWTKWRKMVFDSKGVTYEELQAQRAAEAAKLEE